MARARARWGGGAKDGCSQPPDHTHTHTPKHTHTHTHTSRPRRARTRVPQQRRGVGVKCVHQRDRALRRHEGVRLPQDEEAGRGDALGCEQRGVGGVAGEEAGTLAGRGGGGGGGRGGGRGRAGREGRGARGAGAGALREPRGAPCVAAGSKGGPGLRAAPATRTEPNPHEARPARGGRRAPSNPPGPRTAAPARRGRARWPAAAAAARAAAPPPSRPG